LGKKTTVELASTWPDPGFTGDFLPDAREIDENGFTAEWAITHLNRNYPQSWTDNEFSVNTSEFGVELIQPVDHYQRAFRSVKYAMMFIGLTFLVFLLIEILTKKRLHPIQYVLTGIALIVFYILLVSLSEHTGFTIAYIISAIAIISLISYYIWSNFGQVRFAVTTFAVLTGLYLFLFVTLQLQDYALLFGSIGLFIVLVIFMLLTRKINWYLEEVVE
jgi:inner membrane protein